MTAQYPGSNFDDAWLKLLRPDDYKNPTPQANYHIVVIGAGPAGLITAIGAAGLGAKVALVERHTMGGDCLNVGCVPSKCLLEHSKKQPGDFDGAFEWLRKVRADIAPHDSATRYTELGVDVFLGDAEFVDGTHVKVGDVTLQGRRVAICTGAGAAVPPIPGLQDASPLTNESVFDLKKKPDSIAILGAGAIGCELSQAFARLGVEVSLFEMAPRVLPLESERASEAVRASLEAAGVSLYLGEGVSSVERGGSGVTVTSGSNKITASEVMVALGRRPNTADLNLEAAGVEIDKQGFVVVDDKLRSTNSDVYAAGDCAARLQFTHHADAQARIVVQNALIMPTASTKGLVVPHCTYTTPEVASVGESAASLTEAGIEFDTYEASLAELDRGRAENDEGSYAEVFTVKGKDKILGASIVGHDAGEQLAPICLLMCNGWGLGKAGSTILPYPTRSEYLKRLASQYTVSKFTPFLQKVFKTWLNFIG